MASNLILEIASRLDPKGFEDLTKSMEKVKAETQAASNSAGQMADSLGAIKNAVIGTALSLPLINFTRAAIQSEDATAKFQLQLESLNQSISQSKIEELAQKTRRFGIAETELVQGLSQGLTYLKTTGNELDLLNTAIGITVFKGISLGAAFQQIGLIQLGNTRILRQYGITLDKSIVDPTERTAKAIEDLRKKMEPMAKETGTLGSEMKKAGATIGDMGEKLAASLLPPITAIIKSFNALSDSTKQTILTIGLVITTVAGLSKIFAALKAITLLIGPANIVAATTTAQYATAMGIAAASSEAEALAQAKLTAAINVASLAGQKAAASTIIFGKAIANSNLIFLAITVILGSLISLYQLWKSQQDKNIKAREDQTIADAAAVKQLQAHQDLLKEEISTDDNLIEKIKELQDAKKAEQDAAKTGTLQSSADFKKAQKEFIEGTDEKILSLKLLQEAQKQTGAISTQEAQKAANVRLFGTETKAELASLIQLREAYKATFGEKSIVYLAAEDRVKEARKKFNQEEIKFQQDTNSIKAGLIKESISEELAARKLGRGVFATFDKEATAKMLEVELRLKKDEQLAERATLNEFWLKNIENRKILVQKEESALRKIRLDSARASLDAELEFALKTDEEKAKFTADQERAKDILRRTSTVEQIGKLPEEERTLLKNMEDRTILEAKMAEFAKDRAEANKLESETMIDFQKGRRVPKPGIIEDTSIKGLDVNKALNMKLTTDTTVNLTIANPGELSDAVATAVVGRVKPLIDEIAKNAANQPALTGANLKQ